MAERPPPGRERVPVFVGSGNGAGVPSDVSPADGRSPRTRSVVRKEIDQLERAVTRREEEVRALVARRPERERWRLLILGDALRTGGADASGPCWTLACGVAPVGLVEHVQSFAQAHSDERLREAASTWDVAWLVEDGYKLTERDGVKVWVQEEPLPFAELFLPDPE